MSRGTVTIKFDYEYPDFLKELTARKEAIMNLAAATLQTNRAMIFDNEGAYNGRQAWKPLKFRRGMPLSSSGARGLRGSIAPRNNGVTPTLASNTIVNINGWIVSIGTSLPYAMTHDQGARSGEDKKLEIRAKKAKALKIPVEKGTRGAVRLDGKWYIFRKKVTIPARPFLDWTEADSAELQDTIVNYMKEQLFG